MAFTTFDLSGSRAVIQLEDSITIAEAEAVRVRFERREGTHSLALLITANGVTTEVIIPERDVFISEWVAAGDEVSVRLSTTNDYAHVKGVIETIALT